METSVSRCSFFFLLVDINYEHFHRFDRLEEMRNKMFIEVCQRTGNSFLLVRFNETTFRGERLIGITIEVQLFIDVA